MRLCRERAMVLIRRVSNPRTGMPSIISSSMAMVSCWVVPQALGRALFRMCQSVHCFPRASLCHLQGVLLRQVGCFALVSWSAVRQKQRCLPSLGQRSVQETALRLLRFLICVVSTLLARPTWAVLTKVTCQVVMFLARSLAGRATLLLPLSVARLAVLLKVLFLTMPPPME